MRAQTLSSPASAAGSRSAIQTTFVALLAALALVIGTMALAAPVFAATIVVNEDADELNADGDCSLREAIEAADSNAIVDACLAGTGSADIITVPVGSYQLADALGDLNVDESVSIVGADRSTTTIIGSSSDRVFYLQSGDVSIANVTITGGNADNEDGGGIYVGGDADLTLTNSTVTSNNATNGAGAGIFVSQGSATITGSLISDNRAESGAGIQTDLGDLSVINSTVSGNVAQLEGGGIGSGFGSVSLLNATVDGNQALSGGGIFADDEGGAPNPPSVNIIGSTISNNVATETKGGGDGGGIWSDLDVDMLNSTVSGNSATNTGGGLRVFAALNLDFSTITDNSAGRGGGGLWLIGVMEIFATIVANNDADDCFNGDASFNSFGSNIDSDNTCGLDEPTDLPSTDPVLGPLAANGGPTMTHALLAGSLAIDAVVTSADLPCVGIDQRAVARPQDGDLDGSLVCDIGAYELVAATEGSPSPGAGSPSPGSASPSASALPDTAGSSGAPSSAPWLGFAVLALIGAVALTLEGLRRRYADPSAGR